MDRYAVIGNPVEHSLSPRIHSAFAAQTQQRMEYGKLHCPVDRFAERAREFFAAGGRGLNVTVPFKGAAAELADVLDADAGAAVAVNTLHATDVGAAGLQHGWRRSGARPYRQSGLGFGGPEHTDIGRRGCDPGHRAPAPGPGHRRIDDSQSHREQGRRADCRPWHRSTLARSCGRVLWMP